MKFNKVGEDKQGYPEVSGEYVVICESNEIISVSYSAKHRAFNSRDSQDKPIYEITHIKGWYPKKEFLEELGLPMNEEYEEDDAL